MQFRIVFFLILLFLIFTTKTQAQSVFGRVLDSATLKPLDSAMVDVRAGKLVHQLFTSADGSFKIIPWGTQMVISISKEGYIQYSKTINVNDSNFNLGDILLVDVAGKMGLVDIRVISPVKQIGDTTEYAAEAFKVNPDATAEDLVKKLPGVTVENGKVKAHGEEVKKVTLDGKDFFGDDAQTALRNLPADVVSKVQIFDRMSDQAQFTGFDDGQSAKGINIKTRNGRANGTFGRAFGGYGTDNRYQSGITYNKFKSDRRITLLGMSNNINQQNFTSQDMLGLASAGGGGGRGMDSRGPGGYFSQPNSANFLVDQAGGVSTTHSGGINYNDKWGKKLTLGGSYFYNNTINNNQQSIFRTYSNSRSAESTQYYEQNSKLLNNQQNHRFNIRLEYMFDSSNSIIYTPTLSFQKSHIEQTINAKTFTSLSNLNLSEINNLSNGNGVNLNNNLLYRHKFSKDRRTFTFNAQNQYNLSESASTNKSTNQTYFPIDTSYSTDQNITNFTPVNNYNIRLTYTEPLSKNTMLQVDYRYNLDINKTDRRTLNYNVTEQAYSQFDTILSNQISTQYSYHQPGFSWRYSNKGSSISIGSAYQYSALKGDQVFPVKTTVNKEFNNVLPRVFMNLKLSSSSNMRVMFRTSTKIPSITQFQDVINISNPVLLTTGNPNLKQEVNRNLVVRYNSSNAKKLTSFFLGLFTTQANNYITNATRFITADTQISEGFTALRGSQISSPVNLNGYFNNRVFGYYGFPFKPIKSNLNVNGSYSLGKLPGLINGLRNIATTHNLSGGLAVSSNISEYLDFSLSYTGNYYNATNSTQQSLNNNYFNHTASAKGTYIIKKKLVLSSDVSYNKYSGLSSGFNQQFYLWNAGIAYKFMKNNAAEFKLSCFDILKQNRSINRSITETYIEDNNTNVLTRYLMGTFTYTFKKFANGGAMPEPDKNMHGMPPGTIPPGGMPPGGRPPYNP